MNGLENITWSFISEYLIEKISNERGISKSLSKKLLLNALAYNVVISAIDEQIDFLIEREGI